MAVHVPLSIEAQAEARVLMMSTNNILSPAHGDPIIVPSQDIVLGIYYMTREKPFAKGSTPPFADADELKRLITKGEMRVYNSPEEVRSAYDSEQADLHAGIVVRFRIRARQDGVVDYVNDREIGFRTDGKRPLYVLADPRALVWRKVIVQPGEEVRAGQVLAEEFVRTTVGRVILSEILPAEVAFSAVNRVMNKKALAQLIDTCYRSAGVKATVIFADKLKDTGYHYATRSGISISIKDMTIPARKSEILQVAFDQVQEIERQYNEGLITEGEKYNKAVDIWAKATEDVAAEMMKEIGASEIIGPTASIRKSSPLIPST